MPTGIELSNVKFYNQLHNGSNFLLNPTNYSTTLKGNVGDLIQFTADIGLYYEKELQSYALTNDSGATVTIYMDGANFISDAGFSLNDTVTYGRPIETSPGIWGLTTFDGVITYLDENKVVINVTLGTPPASNQYDGVSGYYAHVLLGTTTPTNAIYSYCINENDDPFNEYSIIDNTLQSFYRENITNSFNNGTWKDPLKGQKTGDFTIKKNAITSRNIRFANYQSVHNYSITHSFIIPYWREDEDVNVENSLPIDDLNGDKSYKYAFKIDIRSILSNYTTSKSAIYENLKGSVGYFDESFNGFSEYYTFSDLTFTDLSNSELTTTLIALSNTQVNFRVTTTKANFTNTHKLVVGHSYLAPESEYSKTKTDFVNNLMYDTLRVTCGQPAISSYNIIDCTATYVDASNIDVQFTVTYYGSQKDKLSDSSEYVLWCDVSDLTNFDTSDKIKLKIKYGTHLKDSDVYNLARFNFDNKFGFVPHASAFNNTDSFSNYSGCVEDGIGINLQFMIKNKVEAINNMKLRILSINSNDGREFELFSRVLDSDKLVKVTGSWKGGYEKNLGYNLNTQDLLNKESLKQVDFAFFDSESATVWEIKTAIKIPYQKWIENNNVDISFFNPLEENNNLNYNTSNYNVGDWEIKACLEFDLTFDNSETTYRLLSPKLNIFDFDESNDYTVEIKTYNSQLTETEGNILTNENTIIKAEFTQLSGDFTDLTGVWGIIRIEEIDSQATNNHELSTVIATYADNLLIPVENYLLTKMEIVSGKIVLTCQTDYTKLSNVNYRISARLGKNDEIVTGAYSVGYSDGYN